MSIGVAKLLSKVLVLCCQLMAYAILKDPRFENANEKINRHLEWLDE